MESLLRVKKQIKGLYRRTVAMRVEGIGVIEIILILVIIIGLVLIFRNQITAIVKAAFAAITSDTSEVTKDIVIPTMAP